jgi:hypothetical protein
VETVNIDMHIGPFGWGYITEKCESRDEALVRAGIGIARGLRLAVIEDGSEVLCKSDSHSAQGLKICVVPPGKNPGINQDHMDELNETR